MLVVNVGLPLIDVIASIASLSLHQMLVQLDMEASADDRYHSLHHSQLERETEEEEEREKTQLAAAQASLAATQVRLNCTETMREMERMRKDEEDGRRQQLTQVKMWVCLQYILVWCPLCLHRYRQLQVEM